MRESKQGPPGDLDIGPRQELESPGSRPLPSRLSFGQQVHGAFLGPHGLRAGWRFLFYVAMWEAFLFLLSSLMDLVQPKGARGIWQEMIAELESLVSAVVPAFGMAAIENGSLETTAYRAAARLESCSGRARYGELCH